MINKSDNIKKIDITIDNLNKDNELLYSNSFIEMVDMYHYNKELQDKDDYQNQITSYNLRKEINSVKKAYNPLIVNLYNNGELVIDNITYSIKRFYIVYDENKNNFNLKCTDDRFKNNEIDYNCSVKFIDSTAFIKLIKNPDINIVGNKIIINNQNILDEYVKNWDGYLHSETKETDAIINHKMIKDDQNEE